MNPNDVAWMAWMQFWQLTAVIAVVAVVLRLMARRRPHLAHVLWLVVLAKCVTPPVMASPGGIFCWLQPPRTTAAALEDSSSDPAFLERASQNRPGRIALLAGALEQGTDTAKREPRTAAESAATSWNDSGVAERVRLTSFDTPSHWSAVTRFRALPLMMLCAGGIWLAGSIVLAMVAATRLMSCLKGIRRSGVDCPAELEALLGDLGQRLGLRRRVGLIVTTGRFGPAVLGLLRPTIVLPAVVVRGKSPRELEPILAHELLHVRRGDLWTGVWQVMAQAIWWFHPLVWLANRLATRAAEACCDEAAIAELGCDPERYAQSLLAVLEQKRGLVSVPAFPGIRPVDVTRERLERIMQLGQGCRKRTPWWCWLVMISAAGVVLPGAALIGTAEEQSVDASKLRPSNPDANVSDSGPSAQTAPRHEYVKSIEGRQSAAKGGIVTVRVANDPRALRPGETIDLLLIDVARVQKAKPDPRVVLEQGNPMADLPAFDEIMRALPGHSEGSVPFLTDVSRQNVRIAVELIASHLDNSRFYPLIGPARLHREHFKCTVRSDKSLRSDWPVPFTRTEDVVEVVYVDKAHLISADGAQGKDLRRALMIETVTVDSVVPPSTDHESYEIRVATASGQAVRLKAAEMPAHLVFFLPAADAGPVSNLSEQSGPRPADANAEPAAGETTTPINSPVSIALHTSAETGNVDQVLFVTADEIQMENRNSIKRYESAVGESTVGRLQYGRTALAKNVRIWLQDNSMKATADVAVIESKSGGSSMQKGMSLSVMLAGNARFSSGGFDVTAKKLTVIWEPVLPADASISRIREMILEGSAEVRGKNLAATANDIRMKFSDSKDATSKRSVLMLLEGDAKLSQTADSGRSYLQSTRIEFSLETDATTLDEREAAAGRSFKDRRKSKKDASSSSNELVTLTYSVADLVIAMEHMSIAMAEDGSLADSKAGTAAAASAGPQASFTELIELIQATIAPDTWEIQKGPGTMMPYRTTLSLAIRQTQAVHKQIAELLRQLRRLQDLQCVLQVDVISTSGGNAKPALKFETDSSGAGDGTTYLSEDQVQTFRDMIRLMEKEEAAAVTGGFKLTFFNGQGAELKLRSRRLLTKTTVPLPALSVAPIIAADRSAIRLQLAVGASKPLDALARTQGYTVKTGQSLLVDLSDAQMRNNLARMVGAQSGAVRRLHKLDLFSHGEPGAPAQPDKAALAERVLLLITPRIVEVVEEEERLGVDSPGQ